MYVRVLSLLGVEMEVWLYNHFLPQLHQELAVLVHDLLLWENICHVDGVNTPSKD